MIHLQAVFHAALQLHEAGRVADAIPLYRLVLSGNPDNGELLYLLGTACHQACDLASAIDFLGRAVVLSPDHAFAHNNLGNALKDEAQADAALSCYDRAIALKADYVEALCNRGLLLAQRGKHAAALRDYDAALGLAPGLVEAHRARAAALLDLGQAEAALASCDTAIGLNRDDVIAHYNRGNALIDLGRADEAVGSYDRVIALQPDHAEAFCNRGLALRMLGRFDEALVSLDRAIVLNPDHAEAFSHRGVVHRDLWQYEAAFADYEQAIALKPDYALVFCHRGVLRYDLRQLDLALADFERAILLGPDYAEAYNYCGNALKELGRDTEALARYDEAIALKPDFAAAYSNRGNTLHGVLRLEDALADYDRAIALRPDYADALWNKALTRLLMGDYREGWALYESRLEKESTRDNYYRFPQPAWRGEQDIGGKRLLIYAEQGAGDAIQFCRYLPTLAALGAELTFLVPAPLVALVSSLPCVMTIVEKGFLPSQFDYHCPLMSLPLALATTVDTIPAPVPYLFADVAKTAQWQARLGPAKKLRVGVAWSGAENHRNDANRSMPFARLARLFDTAVEFHSLQNNYRDTDLLVLDHYDVIVRHETMLEDFSDTAALIASMDLVISVDTAVAHLAGAMGKPVWILLPYAPDYRWLLGREDSPWYPTARLFRQRERGDWAGVVASLVEALGRFSACGG
ncbi:tetratricopeptide repeat protein [Propionivibrio dicarboxylicus]|uniref:Tetratricopeptide (TPR) repeat n=1 Tax=Propionivibrio dicarboxylicus TaxID=83767 RepID=A0A1G7XSP7_9RHOO|nr:tetratricopeptide repeat protein [Propionivibrio dicarboxylicus]SDG87242.1 Tetratricopeptide (TPR) repeat [Propionivibrio dicarboxylicus]